MTPISREWTDSNSSAGSRRTRYGVVAPAVGLISLLAAILSACVAAPRMPALSGAVIEIRRSDGSLARGESGYREKLQLYWFGSGCHLIRLGDVSLLTDPFVSNGIGINLQSSSRRIDATLRQIRPPTAILVNHSHFDHFLDAYAALTINKWEEAGVPLYGGRSCWNLLAGWGNDGVLKRCKVVPNDGGEIINRSLPCGSRLRVVAYRGEHSPHLKCGYTLASGRVTLRHKKPPTSILEYKAGEVLNYLIEIKNDRSSFAVFYLGAPLSLDTMRSGLPPSGTRIDVAILVAPGAANVEGYPGAHIAHLRPRHVVVSHFNTFLKNDPDEQLSILGMDQAKLDDFSRSVQASFATPAAEYPEFKKVHIPSITVMRAYEDARNVIVIDGTSDG